jgi:hypothetical protein
MGHKEFGSLLITDCTIDIYMWQSQPEEMVSPQTLCFKGSFLVSFLLFLLLLSLQNHCQGKGPSSALRKCSWEVLGPWVPVGPTNVCLPNVWHLVPHWGSG